MKRTLLKSKIHKAVVTDANLFYDGSISIDPDLCIIADLIEFEKVDIYNITNGERFSTYVIFGGKNEICLNGAAARKAHKGDTIIIASYAEYEQKECSDHKPRIILLDSKNNVSKSEYVK